MNNTPILQERGLFLSHFPPEYRSTAANCLLEAVRRGCTTPPEVVDHALSAAYRRIYGSEAFTLLLLLAEEDPKALLAGARWALWWESLSPEEKQQLREGRAEEAIERWMEQNPPTDRQLAYLNRLGYRGPTPADRLEASRLIDELVEGVRHV